MDIEFIKLLVGGGVGAGVAGYLLVKTIPGIVKAFREETQELRKMFSDELSKERTNHAGQLQGLHTMLHERDEKLIAALGEIQDRRRDAK